MRQYFQTEQWLPLPLPKVFAFFADPANLPPLMPAWQKARIEEVTLVPPPARPLTWTDERGVAAGSGTQLLITARAAPGVPLRLPWLARIEEFTWDDHFCDVQLRGPFRYWRHCHSVREERRNGQAGTVVTDAVTYALPLWPASSAGVPVARFALNRLFAYRQRQASRLLPAFAAHAS